MLGSITPYNHQSAVAFGTHMIRCPRLKHSIWVSGGRTPTGRTSVGPCPLIEPALFLGMAQVTYEFSISGGRIPSGKLT